MEEMKDERINLDAPRYDQSTFLGRFKHFAEITDWRLCFKTDRQLYEAKELLDKYRSRNEPAGTTAEQVWYAKRVCAAAFHPDSGELQNALGRMNCQVPGGMIVTGTMLAFYKTIPQVIFLQWINQSFNALVNYTNRNANSALTVKQMAVAYVTATTTALGTALGLKSFLTNRGSNLVQRFVPFAAVASANCANIPLMRQIEISNGVVLFDKEGKQATISKVAACKGIGQVVFSRILMAAPGMLALPIIMEKLERFKTLRNPRVNVLVQTLGVGVFLSFMTPGSCAVFPQKCCISSSTLKWLEPSSYKSLQGNYGSDIPSHLYFNKGL